MSAGEKQLGCRPQCDEFPGRRCSDMDLDPKSSAIQFHSARLGTPELRYQVSLRPQAGRPIDTIRPGCIIDHTQAEHTTEVSGPGAMWLLRPPCPAALALLEAQTAVRADDARNKRVCHLRVKPDPNRKFQALRANAETCDMCWAAQRVLHVELQRYCSPGLQPWLASFQRRACNPAPCSRATCNIAAMPPCKPQFANAPLQPPTSQPAPCNCDGPAALAGGLKFRKNEERP